MAIFHFSLFINRKISFYKLFGCGKNGTFDIKPDLNQWAFLAVHKGNPTDYNNGNLYGVFISAWIKLFARESLTILLNPITGHGKWDGREPFGNEFGKQEYNGVIATLTRASVKISKQKYFWKHVAPVAAQMHEAKGFLFSAGIGEVPFLKLGTFSVWQSVDDMKAFAYGMKEHSEVVRKTRQEKWYSEDLFVRFRVLDSFGTYRGMNPLKTEQTK